MWRSRADFDEPPAESPSTMYSSVSDGSRLVQSASLPGRPADWVSSRPLRRVSSRAALAAWRALAATAARLTIWRPFAGLASQAASSSATTCSTSARDRRAGPAFGLALELGVGQLDPRRGDQALAQVIAGDRLRALGDEQAGLGAGPRCSSTG